MNTKYLDYPIEMIQQIEIGKLILSLEKYSKLFILDENLKLNVTNNYFKFQYNGIEYGTDSMIEKLGYDNLKFKLEEILLSLI